MILFNDNRKSKGCRELRKYLRSLGYNAKKFKKNSTYIPKRKDLVINWGTPSRCVHPKELNKDTSVASNKIIAFTMLKDLAVPYCLSKESIPDDWGKVYARTIVTGSKGKGIVIGRKDTVPSAQLYTKAIEGDEYRVHVFNEKVLQVQKKRKMTEEEMRERGVIAHNPLIKNYKNGWIFQKKNFTVPNDLEEVAVSAIKKLGLDFGAVDIVYKFYPKVLEVNTAPALTNDRIKLYAEAIINYYNN